MERDLGLARKILTLVSGCQDMEGITLPRLAELFYDAGNSVKAMLRDDSMIELRYHLILLKNAGYLIESGPGLEIEPVSVDEIKLPTHYKMTWAGHDLLESLA